MQEQIEKIADRMICGGLSLKENTLFNVRNRGIYGKPGHSDISLFDKIQGNLNRDVLLFGIPQEPYRTIINYLAETSEDTIYPRDYETRLLLTDLPVVKGFDEKTLTSALQKRRGAIITGRGIVTTAKNPERAYVIFSSICFACFVKFFSDYLHCARKGFIDEKFQKAFSIACERLDPMPEFSDNLRKGPFIKEEDVLMAMEEAGKLTVSSRLVDSSFGNISFLLENNLYISQTGSFLDELHNRIDRVNIENLSDIPVTVSTEFPVHRETVMNTGMRAVLHGHPKFSVILSMDCDIINCEYRNLCQTKCPCDRYIDTIPVVPGESGTGRYGLCHILPPAMKKSDVVIVYGHGLFAGGVNDFNEPFSNLLKTEKNCRREYFRRVYEVCRITTVPE